VERRTCVRTATLGCLGGMLLVAGLAWPAFGQQTSGRQEGQRWSFSASINEAHFGNLLVLSSTTPGDTVDSVSTGLLFGRVGKRLSLSAYGRASGNYYRVTSAYNRLNYGGGFGLSYRPSPTTRFAFSQGASSGFYSPLLRTIGVALPEVRIKAYHATMLVSLQPSPLTSLQLSGGFAYLGYSSDLSSLDASQLPVDAQVLAGAIPPEEAAIGLEDLPTPVDASLTALGALASEGLIGRQTSLTSYFASLQASRQLLPGSSASFRMGYRAIDYPNGGRAGGGQLDLGASVEQSLNATTSASLQYSHQRNDAQQPPVGTDTAQLRVQHAIGAHLKADVSFGAASASRQGTQDPSGWSWLGGAGISGQYRTTSYGVRYGRSIYQALGFGRNYVTDYAEVLVSRRFTDRVSGRLEARHRRSQDVFVDTFSFSSRDYGGGVGYRIDRYTQAQAYGFLRRIERGLGNEPIKTWVWGFSLVHARSFK
jgi:hypothetical protein